MTPTLSFSSKVHIHSFPLEPGTLSRHLSFFSKTHIFPSSSFHAKLLRIWDASKGLLGTPIRAAAFPLTLTLPPKYQEFISEEKKFFQDFWNPEVPPNPYLSHQEEIRKYFSWKKETLNIEVNGSPFLIEYSLIEPKNLEGKTPKNFVYAPGNLILHDSHIMGLYPFLSSYLEKKKAAPFLPPTRFFILSQYGTYDEHGKKYCPKNIHEPGFIFSQILKALAQKKGHIDLITAHSLGTIIFASSLKHLSSAGALAEVLPKKIYLDRGASSIEKMCDFLGPLKPLGIFLTRISGWDLDIGKELYDHLSHREDQTLLITGVKKDWYFPEEKSLSKSPYVQMLEKKKKAVSFSFDFASQQYHPRMHHTLHNGLLTHYHLTHEPPILHSKESMADLTLRILYEGDTKP